MSVSQRRQLIAGGVGAQNACPHQHSHIHRQSRERAEITRQRGTLQRRRQRTRDRLQIGSNGPGIGRAEGRGGQTAVAADDGGQSLTQLPFAKVRAEHRAVSMAVDVNKAGGNGQSGAVHHTAGVGAGQMPHLGDFSVLDGDIRRKRGAAGTVDNGTAPQKYIKHGK